MLKAMLERAKQARATELEGDEAAEAGFTLIELMVVLLIMGILMAIAIPTFLGVVGGANNTSAQSNLTNALTEATALYQSSNQSFPGIVASTSGGSAGTNPYQASAPEFTWVTTAVGTGNNISIDPSSDGQAIILADESKAADGSSSGTCWYVMYSPNEPPTTAYSGIDTSLTTAGTYYAKGTPTAASSGVTGGCTASNAAAFTTGWASSYGAASSNAS